MGGLLALLTAIDEAHRGAPLDAVILYEPILVDLLDNCRTDHADARSWDQAILQELAAYVASGEPESGVRIFVESWNETSWHALPEAARTHLVAHASNLQLETAAVSGAEVKRSDMRELKTPVLLLRGRLSPPITALIHETALAELPSSREAILTDCGHMGPLLNHQLVAESIAQFLHSPSSCMP